MNWVRRKYAFWETDERAGLGWLGEFIGGREESWQDMPFSKTWFLYPEEDRDFQTLPPLKATHYNLASGQISPIKLSLGGSPMPPLPQCQHQEPIWLCYRHLTTICSLLKLFSPLKSPISCSSCHATNALPPFFWRGRVFYWLFLPLLPTGPLNDGIPQEYIFYFIQLYTSCFAWLSQCTATAQC